MWGGLTIQSFKVSSDSHQVENETTIVKEMRLSGEFNNKLERGHGIIEIYTDLNMQGKGELFLRSKKKNLLPSFLDLSPTSRLPLSSFLSFANMLINACINIPIYACMKHTFYFPGNILLLLLLEGGGAFFFC